MNTLPHLVRLLCLNHEAWIVGGGARVLAGLEPGPPRDFDVLVPHWQWGPASKLIPRGSPANSFGGFKVTADGIEIDVWQGDIGWLLAHAPKTKQRVAVQPMTETVLVVLPAISYVVRDALEAAEKTRQEYSDHLAEDRE